MRGSGFATRASDFPGCEERCDGGGEIARARCPGTAAAALRAPAKIIDLAGAAEIFIGVSLAAWAVLTFRRLQTPVIPIRPARTLSVVGPYTMTRNPMYLSFALIYLGVTFVTNAFWPLLFLPEALVLTYLFAIKREERYLAREFGDAYAEYCARVRRWI
jgi:protein-S-isoprenylcysteine O-methyltransferase Ste14